MAAPSFGASGAHTSGSGSSVSLAVPTGVASGHIVSAVLFIDGSATISAMPTGFAHAEGSPVQLPAGGGQHSLVVAWKRATGSDTGTYDFTLSASTYRAGAAHRYTDCVASGTPFDTPTGSATDTANSTTTPAVSIDTAGADRRLIFAGTNWSGGTWTPPSGFTERMDAGDGVHTMADLLQASQGNSGSITATCTGSDKRAAWLGALIGTTSGGQSAILGQPTETDTALAVTRSKVKAVGLIIEADTAQSVTRVRVRVLGQSAETDTAQALAKGKTKPVGQAVEADAAQAITRAKAKALGQPAEVDTARAIVVGGAVGQSVEADTALAVARLHVITLGQPAETDLARVVGRARTALLGRATEADQALTLTAIGGASDGLAGRIVGLPTAIGSVVQPVTRSLVGAIE